MNKTKIDYADYTWNPVYGCRNGCPYCYARRYCERFGKSFEPHWVQKNFDRAMPKKPSIIFVNSMSDIYWWEEGWTQMVLGRILNNPQHIFLFLSKIPRTYLRSVWFDKDGELLPNVWFGFTATNDKEAADRQRHLLCFPRVWCSAEPLLGPIESLNPGLVKWLVIGAMTGPGAVVPEDEWIDSAMGFKGPLFVKKNMPEWARCCDELMKEYPLEMMRHLGR